MNRLSAQSGPIKTPLELGRFAVGCEEPDRLFHALSQLEEAPVTEQGSAFFRICQSFSLTAAESLLLAVSLWQYAVGEEFWKVCRIAEWSAAFPESGEDEISFLLDPSGELLPAACALMLGRAVRLPGYARLCPGGEPLLHSVTLLGELEDFFDRCGKEEVPLPAMLALSGEPGSGRKFLLAELLRRRGCVMLLLDASALSPSDAEYCAGLALLFNALPCLDGYHNGLAPLADALFDWFSVLPAVCRGRISPPSRCVSLLERQVPPLTPLERAAAMRFFFPDVSQKECARAAGLYRMGIGQISAAAVRMRAEGKSERLFALLREENLPNLTRSAQLLRIDKHFEDLVLPDEPLRQVRRLCSFAAVRTAVWNEWGFERKVPYGRGITSLFYGASGTGKTLAAGIVANELGLPLYRVDLSQMISKYIGETQKNIGQIFDDAGNADCVLFFDEADALFARRSDAGDAQDRYANAETAYLLQRTEQYNGIILMATNLLQNFDEAFRRRIGFMIYFPLPDEGMRERLWQGIFPEDAPTVSLDYSLLARELSLSGAGIRNCAVNAAYLAASHDRKIDMKCVVEAARWEYQKQGTPFPTGLGGLYPAERSLL